jgi:hypothetical protein
VVKSPLTASGVPTAGWVTRALLRLSGVAQALALTLERSAEQEGSLAECREWSLFAEFLNTQFGRLCPRLAALQKLKCLIQGRKPVAESVAQLCLLVGQIMTPWLSVDHVCPASAAPGTFEIQRCSSVCCPENAIFLCTSCIRRLPVYR